MERNRKVRIIPAKVENIRIEKVGIYARVSTAGKAQLKMNNVGRAYGEYEYSRDEP